jgi:hypothetical protein
MAAEKQAPFGAAGLEPVSRHLNVAPNEKPACRRAFVGLRRLGGKFGAGEGARTLDPDLGKVVLYH